jgi:hypothetical protein
VRAIETNYAHHCEAARNVAEEYFDSRKVLPKLLDSIFQAAPDPRAAPANCTREPSVTENLL